MNRADSILEDLQRELGFHPELLGGRATVLAQIERFLATHKVEPHPVADPALWNQLISEVIIPETSFFRYPESFNALADWAKKSARPSPRILCLPCSTGEEAYSIAIALREAGCDSFHISACDASARSIALAELAHYSVRARSGLTASGREGWFNEGHVRNELRATITFQVANAFAFTPPLKSFDVIFCRNLLIYFDAANQQRLFERLDAWLAPGGILFLGPGEATIASAHGWKSTGHSMSFSFKRGESPTSAPPIRTTARPRATRPKPAAAPARIVPPRPSPSPAPAPEIPPLAQATELADAGRLTEAAAALARFHAATPPTAPSLLLRGILEEATAEFSAAEQSYRQALYLNPDELDALVHLARLLEADGRPQAAAPLRRRIERLAQLS
jgi:chemotaxis protein methyltransferase WspC